MRVYLALVALSAGASASPSLADASTAAGVGEPHAERELMTRSEAKTRQLQRKLPKVKAKREKADAKVKKVEDALGLPYSALGDAGPVDDKQLAEAVAAATKDLFTKAELDAAKGEVCAAAGGTWDGAACTSGVDAAVAAAKQEVCTAGGGTWDADTTTCAAAAGGYDLMCEANDCPLRTDGCPGKEHCLVGPNSQLITWVGLTACTLSKDGEVVASNCEK